ncbi:MAG: carbohydrate porin [Gemmatimonadota bacterium]
MCTSIGDRTIWSGAGNSPRSLNAFVPLGLGDSRANQIGGYIGAGLAFTAPIARRSQDQIGLAVAAARNGSHFERAELALGALAPSESTIELTYLAQLTGWLALQPDVQYVINPGGKSPARNALALGFRIALSHRWGVPAYRIPTTRPSFFALPRFARITSANTRSAAAVASRSKAP